MVILERCWPPKTQPAVYIGEITGDYCAEKACTEPLHWRVKWIGEAIPRTHFGKDLLFSFGAFHRSAASNVTTAESSGTGAMRASDWKAETLSAPAKAATATTTDAEAADTDLDELARDQIAALISLASRVTA